VLYAAGEGPALLLIHSINAARVGGLKVRSRSPSFLAGRSRRVFSSLDLAGLLDCRSAATRHYSTAA